VAADRVFLLFRLIGSAGLGDPKCSPGVTGARFQGVLQRNLDHFPAAPAANSGNDPSPIRFRLGPNPIASYRSRAASSGKDSRPLQPVAHWLRHTPMTEPGALAFEFEELPSDIASLNRIVQGLLVHSEWLLAYGIDANTFHSIKRETLPVSERLGELLKLDKRALHVARPPANRSAGTCRDFALALCSFLRATGTPARLRCGFVAYLGHGWEDHWVCEYWDGQRGCWQLSDPQLDEITRVHCAVSFDPSDMPRDAFLTGGEAWLQCRTGEQNPCRFGHGGVKGLWFIRVNVVRDAYALNGRETSAWDRWREAPSELRRVSPEELPHVDCLARRPENPLGGIMFLGPPWVEARPTD
jgi:hypothetical protein